MPANHKDQSRRDKKTGRYSATVLSAEQLQTVHRLALIGCTTDEVSVVLGIPNITLDFWLMKADHPFTVAFRKGQHEGHVTLRRKMFQLATQGDNTTMLIWLSKNLMGWSDSPQIALSVNATANAHADARSPEQIKRELVDLQKAVFLEAKRLNGDN